MLLIMAVNWGVAGGGAQQATAVAYIFSSFVSFLSIGCGCNVNPSISTAVLVYEGRSKVCEHLPFYFKIIFAELFGMTIGALLVFSAANYDIEYSKSFAILEPSPKSSIWRVFFAEVIGSFVFGNFILSIKYHQPDAPNLLACFFAGLSLYGCINMVGGISGGSINPGVGLIQCIF